MKKRLVLIGVLLALLVMTLASSTLADTQQTARLRKDFAQLQQENVLLRQQLAQQQRKTERLQQLNTRMLQSNLATERELQGIWKSLCVRYKAWRELVQQNEPLQKQQQQRDQDLIKAIQNMDAKEVISLLEQGADPNTHAFPDPALPVGRTSDSPSAFTLLVRCITPLPDVSYQPNPSHDTIAFALIAHGADFHIAPKEYLPVLLFSTYFGLDSTTRLLLALGEDPNVLDYHSKSTALMLHANATSTTLLLEHGADPNLKNYPQENTALHFACRGGKTAIETVRLLLEAGANPNARNGFGLTPLMHAQDPQVAALLLQYGADINAKDKDGHSVLFTIQHHLFDFQKYQKQLRKSDSELRAYRTYVAFLKKHGAKE